ncbi:MAG: hypothetical protein QOJ62_884, partial [Actinomycetota bacterium]|nr:hypothetical protein [Actinomycetota bacterium]
GIDRENTVAVTADVTVAGTQASRPNRLSRRSVRDCHQV